MESRPSHFLASLALIAIPTRCQTLVTVRTNRSKKPTAPGGGLSRWGRHYILPESLYRTIVTLLQHQQLAADMGRMEMALINENIPRCRVKEIAGRDADILGLSRFQNDLRLEDGRGGLIFISR